MTEDKPETEPTMQKATETAGHAEIGALAKRMSKDDETPKRSASEIVGDILPASKPHRRHDLKGILPKHFWDQVRAHREPSMDGDPYEELANAMHVNIICKINRLLLHNDDPRLLEIEFGEQTWVDAFTQRIEKSTKL